MISEQQIMESTTKFYSDSYKAPESKNKDAEIHTMYEEMPEVLLEAVERTPKIMKNYTIGGKSDTATK